MKRFGFALALIVSLLASEATAQPGGQGYFVVRLGRDTVGVEEFSMSARELKGTSIARSPRAMVREYTAEFGPKGVLMRIHVTYQRAGGAVTGERDYTYADDSVHVTVRQDTSTNTFAVAASGRPFPFFYDMFAFWQAALEHAHRSGAKEFSLVSGKRLVGYKLDQTGPGTITLLSAGGDFGPLHVTMDKEGHLEKFDMTATTDKFMVERVAHLNVSALAREYAAREKSGSALGVLSPRDTARAQIAGARILVDYGRPAMRGRTIFGGVVPWDSVWRTGANAATQLITDKEIVFGATAVPAGTYSLFSIPSPDGWLLIINKQHGQWGTVYDRAKDLARLPMQISHADVALERFTVEIVPQAAGGDLHLKWEKTEASIPFAVK